MRPFKVEREEGSLYSGVDERLLKVFRIRMMLSRSFIQLCKKKMDSQLFLIHQLLQSTLFQALCWQILLENERKPLNYLSTSLFFASMSAGNMLA